VSRVLLARLIAAAAAAVAIFCSSAASWAGADANAAATIARVERYLNAITTLRADFVQVADDGRVAEGVLYIARPGRLRVEYAPPSKVVMVSDGAWLTYIDGDVGQVSQVPIDQTPAGILVGEEIRLGDGIAVENIESDDRVTRITLRRADQPDEGALTLVFTERPFELRQWTVVDPQGLRTRITLYNLQKGVALDPKLFVAPPPPPESGMGR